ncbi:hypothetical protein AOC36_05575 [Erysipelothrix larvae]|uniref:Reactive intermediate/imine deaminase n=1 Tax=Erysipelothrix larvae TaxID=1514105 RepID=A0A120JTN7_9FIRM|nr:Rid family detoxifying hydrolase [Erysipelothrix larvae]AMC93466.1 hypothetical protein AOC36_05575 [Erysipelothrix larvae]
MKRSIKPNNGLESIGPYSPGLQVGPLVFVSGQLPVDPKTNKLVEGDIRKQAAQVFENMEDVLKASNMSLRQVVKTTVLLQDMNDFSQVNQVYAIYFSPPYPARVCYEVSALPMGASIEVECIAYDTTDQDLQLDIDEDDCGGDCGDDEA